MEQRGVRRITVEPHAASNEKWDSGWVPPLARRVREWAFAEAPRLAYWGGWAGIVGAVLWGGFFLYMQLVEYALWFDWPIGYSLSYLPTQLLAAPLLLFAFCLCGLVIRQEKDSRPSAGLRRIGFALASLGLTFMIVSAIDAYWFGIFIGARAGGLIDFVYSGPMVDWDNATSGGLALVGTGMVLLGIAGVRAKALPAWSAIWFVGAPLVVFLVRIAFAYSLDVFDSAFSYGKLLYGDGVFVALMVLFGVAWAVAGYHLVRSGGGAGATPVRV